MIDREEVIMALKMLTTRVKKGAGTVIKISCNEEFISILSGAVELLKEQEVKPLRCKECSYHRKDDWCVECRRIVKESDYCSFGSWESR